MASGCTCIFYNGITLLNVQMRDFRQEVVKDESGTDLFYQRFIIRAIGYFVNLANYPAQSPTVAIAATGVKVDGVSQTQEFSNSAGYNMLQVRHFLSEQRKPFTLQMGCNPDGSGGTTVVQAFAAASLNRQPQDPIDPTALKNIDVNNGPKTGNVDVVHVSADEVLKCAVDFEICLLECDRDISGAPKGLEALAPAVLSNRWKVVEFIDRNRSKSRTYTGTLRLASLAVNPNDFRGWVVAPLYPGFRRDSLEFDVSLDGLSLAYTIVDKEIYFSAPAPATTWRFMHRETTGSGKQLFGELAVTLGGDRNAPRTLFVAMIAAMIDNVLRVPDPATASGWADGQFFDEITFIDDISDDACVVHGHALITRAPIQLTNDDQNIVGTFKYIFGATLCIPLDQIAKFQQDLGDITVNDPETGPLPYNDVYEWPYDSNRSRGCRLPTITDNKPELDAPLSSVTALACYVQDPCNAIHALQPANNDVSNDVPTTNQGLSNAGGSPPVTVRVAPTLPQHQSPDPSQNPPPADPGSLTPSDPNFWAPGGPTTHYRQQSETQQKPGGRMQLPLAVPPPRSGGGSGGTGNPNQNPTPPPPPTPGPQYNPSGGPVPPTFPTPFVQPWEGASNNGPNAQQPPGPDQYSTGPNCIIVAMAPPLFQRVVRIEAERVGSWPTIPPPVDIIDQSGQTMCQYYLHGKTIPQTIDRTSDGKPIYRVAAEYVYALDRPPSLQGYPVGISSWVTPLTYLWSGPLFAQIQDDSGQATANPA